MGLGGLSRSVAIWARQHGLVPNVSDVWVPIAAPISHDLTVPLAAIAVRRVGANRSAVLRIVTSPVMFAVFPSDA